MATRFPFCLASLIVVPAAEIDTGGRGGKGEMIIQLFGNSYFDVLIDLLGKEFGRNSDKQI